MTTGTGTADDVARDVATVGDVAARVPSRRLLRVTGDPATVVADVVHDSRDVTGASAVMFACLVGEHHDGHAFAPGAVAAGATSLLVDHLLDLDVPQVVVDDTRLAVGHVAATVHGDPSRAMRTIGITGTNGKTTTAHLLGAVLRHAGLVTSVQGTLTGARTTPEATDLQRRLRALADDGTAAVVMEVSSHALALHRVDGMRFDAAVFTNLGRDHLDLHGSMEEYFRAKARLFDTVLSDLGVVNADDPYGQLLLDRAAIDDHGIEMVAFGRRDASDVVAGVGSLELTWRGRRVHAGVGGSINVMNVVAALTAASVLGVDDATAVDGVATAGPVPGRFEVVTSATATGPVVVVDYAHTPDGLEQLLRSARDVADGGRVLVVFGCGGHRDRDKRPQMGHAAVAGADVVVVTSDNPRDEDPGAIIDEVLAGVAPGARAGVVVEPDRRAAIAVAVGAAAPGDVIVVAGKGHETTQDLGTHVVPFDDREVVREVLDEVLGGRA